MTPRGLLRKVQLGNITTGLGVQGYHGVAAIPQFPVSIRMTSSVEIIRLLPQRGEERRC